MDSKTRKRLGLRPVESYPYQVVRVTRRADVVVLGHAMLYPAALEIAKKHTPTCGEVIKVERIVDAIGHIETLWSKRG